MNLWATWCAPCRRELPLLQDASEDLGDRAQIIGVNTDGGGADVRRFLDDAGVTYDQFVDAERRSLVTFGIAALPATIALRADGSVAAVHKGILNRSDIEELVDRAAAAT